MSRLIRDFGAGVRRLRETRDWSQEQLAGRANLNRSYVDEIERGSVVVSIVTMGKLARAFDMPITTLLAAGAGKATRTHEHIAADQADYGSYGLNAVEDA